MPERKRADATESPSSKGTREPSNSNEPIDPVRDGVPPEGQPAPASERVEPSLVLRPGRVRREVDTAEVLLRGRRLHVAELAAERELPVGTAPTVRARNLDGHGSRYPAGSGPT